MLNYYKVESYITEGEELDPRKTIRYEAEIYEAKNQREAAVLHDVKCWESDNASVLKCIRGRYLGDDRDGGAVRVFWLEPEKNSTLYLAHVVTRIIL